MRVLALIISFFIIGNASAGYFDGNKLYDDCRRSKLFVLGYVSGAYDAAETGQATAFSMWASSLDKNFNSKPEVDKAFSDGAVALGGYCAPEHAILEQVTDIFCQYLVAHPAERHMPGNRLLAKALSEAWPCPKKSQ